LPTVQFAVTVDNAFDFCSADYARLYEEAPLATAFQHPIWLDAVYSRLAGHYNAERLVIVGRDEDSGALQFVLPLVRRRKTGIVLVEAYDFGVCDYVAPIVSRSFRPDAAIAKKVLRVLPPCDILRIRPIRGEAVAQWQLLLGGDAVRLDYSAHATWLGDDHQAWRERALAPGFIRTLDRKKQRFFSGDGASVRLLSDLAEIGTALIGIRDLRAGRFTGDVLQDSYVCDLYEHVAIAGAAAGLARTYEIALNGKPIGYAFALTHAGRFTGLLMACDYEVYGRHSPGLLLHNFMIEDWMASGGKIFDFGIGDEGYKKDFGTDETPMFAVTRNLSWRGRVTGVALRVRRLSPNRN
jgi:CelD/BcsL family acetyltransferase involved in cellulose biosynthesis